MPNIQKYKYTEKTVMAWANQFPSLQTYLGKLNSNREQPALFLFDFCDWANLTPDTLLSLKCSYESLEAEKLLDKFAYTKLAFPDSRKWRIIMCVKGFFRSNYKQLQGDAGKFEYQPVREQRFPRKETRLKLYRACYSPRDRALVLFSCCSAIALETLSNLRWSHFEENWMKQDLPHISLPPELLKGHGKGKYRGVRQETFLTPEAKRELIEYRDWFTKTFSYTWSPSDHVFLSIKDHIGGPLTPGGISKIMVELSKRAGVKFSVHDGRRIVETALENSSVGRNWIQRIKGRKVRGEDSPYSRPAISQLREKYKLSLPELEFLSEADSTLKSEMEALEGKVKEKDVVISSLVSNEAKKSSEVEDLKQQMAKMQEDQKRQAELALDMMRFMREYSKNPRHNVTRVVKNKRIHLKKEV